MNDSLLASGYTDNSGMVDIILDEPIQVTGNMELNVTARNKIPVFETVQVLTDIPEFNLSINLEVTPNPCSDFTHLRYTISDQRIVNIDLYEISGAKVKGLLNEQKIPGTYEQTIDLSDLKPGVYFCVFKTLQNTETKKIIKLQ